MKHRLPCDCFECTDDHIKDLQAKYFKPNLVDATGRTDHADVLSKPASYFLDSILVAKSPVTVYKNPDIKSDIVIQYPKGSNVGKISSYVVREGQVWWDVYYFSGKHAGWVKHDKSLFDASVAEQTSSGLEHEQEKAKLAETSKSVFDTVGENAEKLIAGVSDAAGSIGSNLKWILLAIAVIAIVFAFLKYGGREK